MRLLLMVSDTRWEARSARMGKKSKAARGGAARRAPTAASPDTLLADGRALHAHAMMACAEGKVARLRELLAMLSFEGVQELLVLCGLGGRDVAPQDG